LWAAVFDTGYRGECDNKRAVRLTTYELAKLMADVLGWISHQRVVRQGSSVVIQKVLTLDRNGVVRFVQRGTSDFNRPEASDVIKKLNEINQTEQ
jgi:hypothetical protein